MLPLPK
ncbi:unnamed protein product [Cuscuta epithymum]|nr:unnamed protein product [Cuscuta epithymum]